MIELNEDHKMVLTIFGMAKYFPFFLFEPHQLTSWVDSGYEPQDEALRDFVHDLRLLVKEKTATNGRPYTGSDLLDEFLVNISSISVAYNWVRV